jgi:hypothetical protein
LNILFLLFAWLGGQNPSGTVLSEERYAQIYAICQKHDLIIMEDDPYFWLQFQVRSFSFLSSSLAPRARRLTRSNGTYRHPALHAQPRRASGRPRQIPRPCAGCLSRRGRHRSDPQAVQRVRRRQELPLARRRRPGCPTRHVLKVLCSRMPNCASISPTLCFSPADGRLTCMRSGVFFLERRDG